MSAFRFFKNNDSHQWYENGCFPQSPVCPLSIEGKITKSIFFGHLQQVYGIAKLKTYHLEDMYVLSSDQLSARYKYEVTADIGP